MLSKYLLWGQQRVEPYATELSFKILLSLFIFSSLLSSIQLRNTGLQHCINWKNLQLFGLFPNSVQLLAVEPYQWFPPSLFTNAKIVQCVFSLFWGKECKEMWNMLSSSIFWHAYKTLCISNLVFNMWIITRWNLGHSFSVPNLQIYRKCLFLAYKYLLTHR